MQNKQFFLRALIVGTVFAALYVAALAFDAANTRAAAKREGPAKYPRAVIDSLVHDFGMVDPHRAYQHVFKVRNAGEAPLLLASGGTTSKSLKLDIDPHTVAPGVTADVTIGWSAENNDETFTQRAKLTSNDPTNPAVEFELRGKTHIQLAAEPPILTAPRIGPQEKRRLETKVVSQVWNTFTLEIVPSLANATWSLEPLDADALHSLQVKSGYRLVIDLPRDLPFGRLQEHIRVVATPADGLPSVERTLPIEGNVLSRLAVFGADLEGDGTIDAGTINARTGYSGSFVIQVTDENLDLGSIQIAAEPEFIEAHVKPYDGGQKPGMYRLHVRIPPREDSAVYQGENRGSLTISFDHPRIRPLQLGVEFVVLNSVRQRIGEVGNTVMHKP